jgi:hypothetical protein
VAVKSKKINPKEFQRFIAPMIGKRVSRARCGFGESLHVDFGRLRSETIYHKNKKVISQQGEFDAMIESAWRVEQRDKILFCYFSDSKIKQTGLKKIKGLRVTGVTLETRLLDIVIALENGIRIRTFKSEPGDSACTIFLPPPNIDTALWITSRHAQLIFEMGYRPPFPADIWKASLT